MKQLTVGTLVGVKSGRVYRLGYIHPETGTVDPRGDHYRLVWRQVRNGKPYGPLTVLKPENYRVVAGPEPQTPPAQAAAGALDSDHSHGWFDTE